MQHPYKISRSAVQLSLGYYGHALVSLLMWERQRRDFTEFFLHHVATLLLLVASWLTSFHRVGALILLVHDIADPLLHAAKAANYARKQVLCDVLFVSFSAVFAVSRLYWYPAFLVYPVLVMTSDGYVQPFPFLHVFCLLLLALCLLHVYWMAIISKVVYGFCVNHRDSDTGTETDTTGPDTDPDT